MMIRTGTRRDLSMPSQSMIQTQVSLRGSWWCTQSSSLPMIFLRTCFVLRREHDLLKLILSVCFPVASLARYVQQTVKIYAFCSEHGGAEHGRVLDHNNHIESGISSSDVLRATMQTFRKVNKMLLLKIVRSLDEVTRRQTPNPFNRSGLCLFSSEAFCNTLYY